MGKGWVVETRFEFETALGPVWFWGRDTGRPVLLMISGAFNDADYMCGLQSHFPDADVLRAHLPGNHCPELSETSLRAYVAAFDEALGLGWPRRPMTVLGASTGALVALGLRHPAIWSVVAIEPLLLTAGVWPLRLFAKQAPAWGAAFVEAVFGVGPDGVTPRDHSWVLDGLSTSTVALVGDDPLGSPRAFVTTPTLVTSEARALLAAHPAIDLRVAAGAGHNIPLQASRAMHAAVAVAVGRLLGPA